MGVALLTVGCHQQQLARRIELNTAEVTRLNTQYRNSNYQRHVEQLARRCSAFKTALANAVRAELRHVECGAGDCWCGEKTVEPVTFEGGDFDKLKNQLSQVCPSIAPCRERVAPDTEEPFTLDAEGAVIPNPQHVVWVCPPTFPPQDILAFYDAAGKKVCELCLWELKRESDDSEPGNEYDAFMLPETDFARLFSQPGLQRYISNMPDWAQKHFGK